MRWSWRGIPRAIPSRARAGKLEFLGGKPELLRLGHFDDVDLAMMIHGTSRPEDGKAGVPTSNNGCIVKTVRYIGKAAHAGGAPHMGINALYAANIALMAINAIRETFRDEDTIRVHPIITHGGSQVNVIPGDVRLETYVRGRTVEAILMAEHFRTTMAGLVGEEHYRRIPHRTGSTDMGDLSQVMPILHPYIGGARGSGHSADFQIEDKALAYVAPAKALAAMAIDMLADGAAGAREVVGARPPMTRAQYLSFQRGIARREVYEA